MTQLTVNLSDDLAARLAGHEESLPRIIERGLDDLEASTAGEVADVRDLLERLAELPSPEEVMRLRASPLLQARVSELLEKNRDGGLTSSEEQELSQIEWIEHLVRMAKGKAAARLKIG